MTIHFDHSHALGSPVVALHSSASNHIQWKNLMETLEDRHEVFAFDLPGYGSASQAVTDKANMASIAQHVIDRIEEIEEPIHLVGHSYGGAVAIKVAMMRPDLIKSLNLYEPAVFHLLDNENAADRALLDHMKAVETSVEHSIEAETPEKGMEMFVDFWNQPGSWKSMPEKVQSKIAMNAETVLGDFAHIFSENWTADELSEVKLPAQLLMGMESPTPAQRAATLVFQNIAGAELVMLPGLGHMAPITASDWVNPRICQHIARVDRSADQFSWPRRMAA